MTGVRARQKWPPAAALGTAAVLVFLILPNPFRIPNNNPTASAEYAPVPGKQESAQDANFGETAQATSGGIGAGGQDEGLLPGTPFKPPPQFKPRQKPCYGNPPRQTEDPLSPPCVPFFAGDNGGKTYKQGVTGTEITVVLYNDFDMSGDMTQPWRPSDEEPDHQSNYEREYIVRTVKAQLRYFQKHYQTYGRRVKLVAQPSQGGLTTACAQRAGEALATVSEFRPFAAVQFGGEAQCYLEEVAKRDLTGFGVNFDVPQSSYQTHAPKIWGFFPSQEVEAKYSASFICRSLRGRTAKFAGDPELRDDTRTFGFIRPRSESSQRGPSTEQLADLLVKYTRDICGLDLTENERLYHMDRGGKQEAASIMTDYKTKGITTIICYCIPVPSELSVSTFQNAARAVEYYPEWYWDHASAMDRPIWLQTYHIKDERFPSFGVSYLWRANAFREQFHYQAYLSEEPGTTPNVRFNFTIYHLLLNLFQGIQGAGPNLNPESIERGMRTFQYLNRDEVLVPVGGYGDYGPKATSDYTFVDTAMAWWWDPEGTPPGGVRGEGCIRLMNEGRRYFWDEWPRTDERLFVNGAPCTQDTRKLKDPAAGGL